MKTSQQWWAEVKQDSSKFNDWLLRQYRGELSAARRVAQVADLFKEHYTDVQYKAVKTIAKQEAQHAAWIKELLENRGITPNADQENAEKRYWKAVDLSMQDFRKTMAVGAHAEKMRLDRIQTIADDHTAPWDVREIFIRILHDELFHERVFREIAGWDAMNSTKEDHEEGKRLLGLEP